MSRRRSPTRRQASGRRKACGHEGLEPQPCPTRRASRRASRAISWHRPGSALDGDAKAHRIQLAGIGRQAGLNIAQALAPSQLRKGHGAELFGARQRAHAGVAAVTLNGARDARPGHKLNDLCEQGLACEHERSPRMSTPGRRSDSGGRHSSRHQTKSAQMPRYCLQFCSAGFIQATAMARAHLATRTGRRRIETGRNGT